MVEAIFIYICVIIHFYHVYLQSSFASDKVNELDFSLGLHYYIHQNHLLMHNKYEYD